MFLNEFMLSDFLDIYLEMKMMSHEILFWELHPMSHILWGSSILSTENMNYSSSVWALNFVWTLAFQCFISRSLGNFFLCTHKSLYSDSRSPTLSLCSFPHELEHLCLISDLFHFYSARMLSLKSSSLYFLQGSEFKL